MFIEKSMDHFEGAVQMLLRKNGWKEIQHLDALSLRTFGFSCSGQIEEWFKPSLELPQVVHRLETVTGIKGWHLASPGTEEALVLKEGFPFVVGPARYAQILPDVRARYYHGNGRYFYCCGGEKGYFFLCDLNGLPVIPIEWKKLRDLVQKEQLCILWVEGKETDKQREYYVDYSHFLREGLSYRAGLGRMTGAFPKVSDKGSRYLSFEYGVINYGIQLRKTIAFVEDTVGENKTFTFELKKIFRQLYKIRERAEATKIPDWDENIWRVINEYVSSKGITIS